MKPLGRKTYGSIPHLLGSKLGEGDHHCHEGQHKIATEKTRDKHDFVIVQEKYDGSNVFFKILGRFCPPQMPIISLSKYFKSQQKHLFSKRKPQFQVV